MAPKRRRGGGGKPPELAAPVPPPPESEPPPIACKHCFLKNREAFQFVAWKYLQDHCRLCHPHSTPDTWDGWWFDALPEHDPSYHRYFEVYAEANAAFSNACFGRLEDKTFQQWRSQIYNCYLTSHETWIRCGSPGRWKALAVLASYSLGTVPDLLDYAGASSADASSSYERVY